MKYEVVKDLFSELHVVIIDGDEQNAMEGLLEDVEEYIARNHPDLYWDGFMERVLKHLINFKGVEFCTEDRWFKPIVNEAHRDRVLDRAPQPRENITMKFTMVPKNRVTHDLIIKHSVVRSSQKKR